MWNKSADASGRSEETGYLSCNWGDSSSQSCSPGLYCKYYSASMLFCSSSEYYGNSLSVAVNKSVLESEACILD